MNTKTIKDPFFDSISAKEFRIHADIHWSTSDTIKNVVTFLIENGCQSVLDIGSGVGKFCILGAMISDVQFSGVEIREALHNEAKRIQQTSNLPNIHFINDDVKNIDFSFYDAFYYYNPFCEHLATADFIDDSIDFSENKFYAYENIILDKFNALKKGTIVILHFSQSLILSKKYKLEEILENGTLTLWKKES